MKTGVVRLKRLFVPLGLAVVLLISEFPVVQVKAAKTRDAYEYGSVLQKALYFYDANMCGGSVEKVSLLDWRKNCHTVDKKVKTAYGTLDLSGGYHDAGDYVKFGLTQAYTLSMLGIGYYYFPEGYEKTGQQEHIQTVSAYFADYLKKCTVFNKNNKVKAFCYQVGDGYADHAYWGSPEGQKGARPVYFATAKNPATDIVSNTAGALALYSTNFHDTEALDYAKALYVFAQKNDKKTAREGCEGFYPSDSYLDDLSWAAACLYKATGKETYLKDCKGYLEQAGGQYLYSSWCPDWENVWLLTAAMIGDWEVVKNTLDTLLADSSYITPQGYYCFGEWGSARYNCNTQLLGLIYDKNNGTTRYTSWAKTQMNYLLGDNKKNRCYVVGLTGNSVKHPHHAASSGLSDFPVKNDTRRQKYVLTGALVGGPGRNDQHYDYTDDYQFNEVTIDYNAGFCGALSGLSVSEVKASYTRPTAPKTIQLTAKKKAAVVKWSQVAEAAGYEIKYSTGKSFAKTSAKAVKTVTVK